MIKWLKTVFVFIGWAASFPAIVTAFPLCQTDSVRFFVDTASFLGDEGYIYQEIYYEIPCRQLRFVNAPGNVFQAEIFIETTVLDLQGTALSADTLSQTIIASDEEGTRLEKSILQQSAFFLLPGEYDLIVKVSDVWQSKKSQLKGRLHVKPFPTAFCSSEPEFALRIISDVEGVTSVFKKGNTLVHPCASRTYGQTRTTLPIYIEFYHCDLNTPTLSVSYGIENAAGALVTPLDTKAVAKPADTCALTFELDVGDLLNGAYELLVQASDGNHQYTIKRPFKIESMSSSLSVSPEELIFQRLLIAYLGTAEDMTQFEALNQEGKVAFLIDFWKKRDPNPMTVENEYLHDLTERVRQTNEYFTSVTKKGYETDAGRIFIKFGPPNDIEKIQASPNEEPHEIWTYYDKNRRFWFLTAGAESYQLIHVENEFTEVGLANWGRLIRKF